MSYQILMWLPYLVAAAAVMDAARLRAAWYWYLIILMFPVMGSIIYFGVSRSTQFGGADVSRRAQARKRLQALRVQLSHWRGPAVLAEAGEELLVLGKTSEAIAHFQEAKENGAAPEDVNLGLAQALQLQGSYREAVPLLTELCDQDRDFKLGEAQLALARSLDESSDHERAEKVLRDLLTRRSPFEARVRLARILRNRGAGVEADALLEEVANDAILLPRYLKRHHGAWIRAGRRLKRGGSTKLPKPRADVGSLGAATQRNVFAMAGIGLALLAAGAVTLFIFAVYWSMSGVIGAYEEREALRAEYDALDAEHPWPHEEDLSLVDLTEDELQTYLEIRVALEPRAESLLDLDPSRPENFEDVELGWLEMLGFGGLENDYYQARSAFDREVLEALERRDVGPGQLMNMLTLVEWRWLRRNEAMMLGLPDYYREDLTRVRRELQSYEAYAETRAQGLTDNDYEGRIARIRAKHDDLERQALENVALSGPTEALFEAHRDELDRFEPDALQYWIKAVDRTQPWP